MEMFGFNCLVCCLFGTGCSIMIDKKFKLRTVLGQEYNLEPGKGVFFLKMFGHFEIVSSKVLNSFMYFFNFGGTLILKFLKQAGLSCAKLRPVS